MKIIPKIEHVARKKSQNGKPRDTSGGDPHRNLIAGILLHAISEASGKCAAGVRKDEREGAEFSAREWLKKHPAAEFYCCLLGWDYSIAIAKLKRQWACK